MDLYSLRFKLQDVEKEILKEKDNQEKNINRRISKDIFRIRRRI